MVHPFLFIFPLRGLPGARPQEDPQEEDPKQTQSRPINPKQPGITQGFPALFSQLALAGDGAPYIALFFARALFGPGGLVAECIEPYLYSAVDSRPGPGGSRTTASCQPEARRSRMIPLRYSVGSGLPI